MDERDTGLASEKKGARFSIPGIVVGIFSMAAGIFLPYYIAYKAVSKGMAIPASALSARFDATFVAGLVILIRSFVSGRTLWRWVLTLLGAVMLGGILTGTGPTGRTGDLWVQLAFSIVCLYFGFRTKKAVPRATTDIKEPVREEVQSAEKR